MLIEALGGTVIEYAGQHKCCGFPIITMNKEASLKQAGRHLGDAIDAQADCLVTPCPLCHLNLDLQQPLAAHAAGRDLGLPVLHLPQLLGLALGLEPDELGHGAPRRQADDGHRLDAVGRGGRRRQSAAGSAQPAARLERRRGRRPAAPRRSPRRWPTAPRTFQARLDDARERLRRDIPPPRRRRGVTYAHKRASTGALRWWCGPSFPCHDRRASTAAGSHRSSSGGRSRRRGRRARRAHDAPHVARRRWSPTSSAPSTSSSCSSTSSRRRPATIDDDEEPRRRLAFVVVSFIVGQLWGNRLVRPMVAWLRRGPRADRARARGTLRLPLVCASIDGTFWIVAAVLFAALNLDAVGEWAWHVGSTILLGGMTVTAVSYLISERISRGVIARALAYGPPSKPFGPGVKGRLSLAWLMATGMPLAGLILLGCVAPDRGRRPPTRSRSSVLVLGVGAASIGLLGDGPRREVGRRPAAPDAPRARPDRGRRPRRARARRRRLGGRARAERLQPDGRRAARARADPRPVRPARRRGRRARRARRRRDAAGRRGARGGGAVRRPRRLDAAGRRAPAARGRRAAEPLLRDRRRRRRPPRRLGQQVRGRRGARRVRRAGGRRRVRDVGARAPRATSTSACAASCPSSARASASPPARRWPATSAPSTGWSTR